VVGKSLDAGVVGLRHVVPLDGKSLDARGAGRAHGPLGMMSLAQCKQMVVVIRFEGEGDVSAKRRTGVMGKPMQKKCLLPFTVNRHRTIISFSFVYYTPLAVLKMITSGGGMASPINITNHHLAEFTPTVSVRYLFKLAMGCGTSRAVAIKGEVVVKT
jgi:hypothetical protein